MDLLSKTVWLKKQNQKPKPNKKTQSLGSLQLIYSTNIGNNHPKLLLLLAHRMVISALCMSYADALWSRNERTDGIVAF